MEIFALLSVVVLILTAVVVVIKTFALWRRTRGLPELLLSLYLICATVLGYPLAIAIGQIHPADNWLIHVVAELVMACGWVCLLLFTLNVFQPDARWARGLVGVTIGLLVAAVAAYIVEVTSPAPRAPAENPVFGVVGSIPVAIAYFWNTFEAFAYYRQLKLRLRLGLADKGVVNRMLLWGLMTLSAGIALVINMVAMMMGVFLSPPIVVVSSILGLVMAGSLFLAFHPPAWYRGWVDDMAPAEII